MIGGARNPVARSSLVAIAVVVAVLRTTVCAAVLLPPPRERAQPAVEWADAMATEERGEDAAAAARVVESIGSGVAARLEADASAWPRAFAKLLLDGAEQRPASTAFAHRHQPQQLQLWQRTLDEMNRKPEANVRQIAEVYSTDVLLDGADAPLPGVGDDAVVITRSKQRRTRSRRKRNFAKISNRRRPAKKMGKAE